MSAQGRKQNGWIWKVRVSGILRAFIVAVLVLLQFLFILYLSVWLRETTVYYYTLVTIASYFVIISLVNDSRSVSYKVSWISIVLLLPVSGHVMYVLWGRTSSEGKISAEIRRRISYGYDFCTYAEETMQRFEQQYRNQSRIAKYLQSKHFPLYKNNQLRYYGMGEDAFEAIFEDLRQAKRYIFLNFYIVAEGRLWERTQRWRIVSQLALCPSTFPDRREFRLHGRRCGNVIAKPCQLYPVTSGTARRLGCRFHLRFKGAGEF